MAGPSRACQPRRRLTSAHDENVQHRLPNQVTAVVTAHASSDAECQDLPRTAGISIFSFFRRNLDFLSLTRLLPSGLDQGTSSPNPLPVFELLLITLQCSICSFQFNL
jgi:hypothetical protein